MRQWIHIRIAHIHIQTCHLFGILWDKSDKALTNISFRQSLRGWHDDNKRKCKHFYHLAKLRRRNIANQWIKYGVLSFYWLHSVRDASRTVLLTNSYRTAQLVAVTQQGQLACTLSGFRFWLAHSNSYRSSWQRVRRRTSTRSHIRDWILQQYSL